MTQLHPWATGPFELLVHAEQHLRDGGDFDRRIALIGFDNAIEVSVSTYLSLHPIHRGNRQYKKEDVDGWLIDYHKKLDFLDCELASRKQKWEVQRGHIVWCHDHRNEQYHGGNKGTPEKQVLELIRKAAIWVFGFLFDVQNVAQVLEEAVLAKSLPVPQRDQRVDRVIDNRYGMVEVAEQVYYTSEILFGVDHAAYQDLGVRLLDSTREAEMEEAQE
jgi:hypothetical protein